MSDDTIVDQPPPVANNRKPVWELVLADMQERDRIGRMRYGTPLQSHNGRKPLIDAYQEILDMAVYIRQAIEENTTDELERLKRENVRLQNERDEMAGVLDETRDQLGAVVQEVTERDQHWNEAFVEAGLERPSQPFGVKEVIERVRKQERASAIAELQNTINGLRSRSLCNHPCDPLLKGLPCNYPIGHKGLHSWEPDKEPSCDCHQRNCSFSSCKGECGCKCCQQAYADFLSAE